MMTWRALSEAWWALIPLLLVTVALAVSHWYISSGIALLLTVAVALFFRDPTRTPAEPGDQVFIAPADGLVDAVEELPHIDAIGGPGLRISIFLSVFDVHINRAPVAGRIEKVLHTKGWFLDARRPDSAWRNENQLWVFSTPRGTVAIRQIAGLIARRIVGWKKEGEPVLLGERLGLIRFGSRTDLYAPPGVTSAVKVGDRVCGGETVLARWPANP
jgi:phosphatidylserine decarboxylase